MRFSEFELQPQLQNQTVRIQPLLAGDFEALYVYTIVKSDWHG